MSKVFLNILAVLNLSEGVIHVVTAGVSFWGMFSLGVWDWRVATSPSADLLLGFVSLVTGLALRQWNCRGGVMAHSHQCLGGIAAAPTA